MLKALFSKPYSKLFIIGDGQGWAIDEDAKELLKMAKRLNITASIAKRAWLNLPQVVHYTSQFSLKYEEIYKSKQRISVDYYHGKPEQDESFKKCFEALEKHQNNIHHVRVSTKEMEKLIKSTIDPDKVMRIPIGINLDLFTPQTERKKTEARIKLDLPIDAIVIGSFQKDGVGWGNGDEPKYIKGPDIFLKVVELLKSDFPNLHVLLSAPARGYIMKGLASLGVPFTHKQLNSLGELSALYDALDLYIICSREEGGPKACLESMAKCVPLVTTEVGQCKDLVKHRVNAMMTPIDNAEALYKSSVELLSDESLKSRLIDNGLLTAVENSYEAQLPLWREYFKKLIVS